jgi:threonine dehydratase
LSGAALTPLQEAPPELGAGPRALLKREDLHELGAFKWRGALPTLTALRERGADTVVTFSTGNHGAATAWAARRLGMRAVVFLPAVASRTKVELLESLGATLRLEGAEGEESKALARAWAGESGFTFFEDGAEPTQFEGYGVIADEILEQAGEPPARVVVPVGDGALAIGIAGRMAERHPDCAVVGVVAKNAPALALSVAAGEPVRGELCDTFADGMAIRAPVPAAVAALSRLGVPLVQVSERALARGVGAYHRAGIRVEGSAAASLAALELLLPVDGTEVLLITGRNIDDELHRRAVEEPESFPD